MATRVNQALGKLPQAWAQQVMATATKDAKSYGDSSARITLRTKRLLALSYVLSPPPNGGNHPPFRTGMGVTVDLWTGRLLGPSDIFRPGTFTELTRRAAAGHSKVLFCGQPPAGAVPPFPMPDPAAEDQTTAPVELALASDHVILTVNPGPLSADWFARGQVDLGVGCPYSANPVVLTLPYSEIRDLLRPDAAAMLPT